MKKSAIISIRVKSEVKKALFKLSNEYGISASELINVIVTDALINNKASDKLKKEIKILLVKISRKELCNRIYISKNMYRRVMDIALSSSLISGTVNMKSVNVVIDSFVEEFDSYDVSLKEKIGVDFKLTAKRLRSRDFLSSQSRAMKTLAYVSSK